jgi:tyrosyl-tRNA synthetase
MLQGGGVSVNRQKIADINHIIDKAAIIAKNYIIIQKGKKNYYLIKCN